MTSRYFFAGFVSGIAGLIVGSPLDILKTNDQNASLSAPDLCLRRPSTWTAGLLMPFLGLGFLNAILFWSYGLMTLSFRPRDLLSLLLLHFLAGLFSGLCVCIVSIPTEVVKVRAQTSPETSIQIVRDIFVNEGLSGFGRGGLVTVARDAIGYGFYFLAYDGLLLALIEVLSDTWAVLIAGGLAGCVSWFSVFPLDTVKTRLQAKTRKDESHQLLEDSAIDRHAYRRTARTSQAQEAIVCMRHIYLEGGIMAFFRGLPAAMLRAFLVNAVIFYVDTSLKATAPGPPGVVVQYST